LSMGLLGLAAMPSHLPPATRATKAGPLPSPGVMAAGIDSTTDPSDSLPARRPFALGLWARASPDVGRWVGPLLFRVEPSSHALLPTPGKSCAAPNSDTVCCLRRDMIGSAFPPFGSLISRGCKVHPFGLGLRLCSPRPRHTPRRRLLTLRLAAEISRDDWSLLRGASALTAAGLAPAGSTQLDPATSQIRTGHTIGRMLSGEKGVRPLLLHFSSSGPGCRRPGSASP